jgi:hypothetical protein
VLTGGGDERESRIPAGGRAQQRPARVHTSGSALVDAQRREDASGVHFFPAKLMVATTCSENR